MGMTAATETLRLKLTLPKHVVEHLRDEVERGSYATANEFVEALLESDSLFDGIPAGDVIAWANTEGVQRLSTLAREPTSGLTADQAFAGLTGDEDE